MTFKLLPRADLFSSYTDSALSSQEAPPLAIRLLPATSGHRQELWQEMGEASEPVQTTGSEQEWISLVQIPALGPEPVTLGKAPNSRVSVLSNPKEG